MPKNVATSQETRDLGEVVCNAVFSLFKGNGLAFIHFVAGEASSGFDMAPEHHQSLCFPRVSRVVDKLSQPRTKRGIQGFALSSGNELSLPDYLFISAKSDFLHPSWISRVFG
jgi:hypothetical protein